MSAAPRVGADGDRAIAACPPNSLCCGLCEHPRNGSLWLRWAWRAASSPLRSLSPGPAL